ncbi:hypothetical protein L249_3894 [Ophiocordyceps polyrhachis-furcata BCC 54312]|uniref:ML-like domain-containing protein n=1 Tax=Ophiocordyceps polyrhachis-furcata BCC 54312 TaxID=1330021 RepID=A0A367L5W2_9HYPO|nr:hypothetical protein L249_3894 [Ophiocordyceps polyrhachis-furcata BCC 54312]
MAPLHLASSLLFLGSTLVSAVDDRVYIKGDGIDGVSRQLDVARYPALYTGDFDDCLDNESLFNVTKFDAAYYADNLTVLFHLDATSNIRRENLILHISVEAYGENRFNMTYDPCKANIATMCPLNASVPISAFATIPISPNDVAGIPSIALGIPDLEGFARLQIFANSTKTRIGCFQAVMTNGNSFSQPKAVASVLAILTALAVLASFATAVYGLSIPHMRMHYAHSFSVLIVFETFQSIFFSGALTVNWPSVLPAWWSNFAWSAGVFADLPLLDSLSAFTGSDTSVSHVGAAGSYQINNSGGLLRQIYGRALVKKTLSRRAAYNASNPYDYNWNGHPRTPGMPMPGTWPGFAGTLSVVGVPPAEAFMVSLIWLLVILAAVVFFVVAAKLLLDLLRRRRYVKTDGFDYFRSHLGGYVLAALLRTMFIAFFAIMTLAMYQFSLHGPAGPTAIAAIVFIIFLGAVGGASAQACRARLGQGKFEVVPDTIRLERGTLFGKIPFIAASRASRVREKETSEKPYLLGAVPFFRVKFTDDDADRKTVHRDDDFIKRFGWLAGRYRRTKWWFFSVYIAYLFVRACFIGGGSRSPLAQVFGLFIFELLALLAIIKTSPFEGNRNTAMSTWMLSISKMVTCGLSIAFLPDFSLSRIVATVLGIIIIVVQGFVAVAVLVLISLGAVSTMMSLSRNREEFPSSLDQSRIRYFLHMEAHSHDLPRPPKSQKRAQAAATMQPTTSFNVKRVRRAPKDEEEAAAAAAAAAAAQGDPSPPSAAASLRRSRANSTSSLPRTGRSHRKSWNSKDLAQWDAEMNRGDVQRSNNFSSPRSSAPSSLRLHGLSSAEPASAGNSGSPARRPPPMTPMLESVESPLWGTLPQAPLPHTSAAEDKSETPAMAHRHHHPPPKGDEDGTVTSVGGKESSAAEAKP